MKSALQILFAVVIGASIGLGIYILKEKNEEEAHPLENEWAEIQKEFYRHYLTEKTIPENLDFLSNPSKQIIEIYQDQIEWDEEKQTLTLTYTEPVTIRLGLLRKKAITMGASITPEMIEHNSQILKDAGKLN